ncbi:hypothetical protein BDV12DRAFT_169268, partial [Aspergillus spectabilis]
MTEENRSLKGVITELKELAAEVESQRSSPTTPIEDGMKLLAAECKAVSTQLLDLHGKISPKNVTGLFIARWDCGDEVLERGFRDAWLGRPAAYFETWMSLGFLRPQDKERLALFVEI